MRRVDAILDGHSMNTAHQTVTEVNPLDVGPPRHLASWYAPGWSDRIGDRLLMFDNTSAPSLELLRFNTLLASAPGFETALRERVELLRGFRHPSFSEVRAVESLDGGNSLALVSNHVPGKRLSEILREAKGPSFALALIRQLTPALALLQRQGDGVAHGALGADRIVVTPEGRLVIVEHVLGPALERLNFTAGRLWADLRIPVAAASTLHRPRLDSRTDVVQLALTALTLLLGRPLRPDETSDRLPALLDDIDKALGRDSASSAFLRTWLGRALQVDGRLFGSAVDAQEALEDLPHDRGQQAREFSRMLAGAPERPDDETARVHTTADEAILVRQPAVEEAASIAPPLEVPVAPCVRAEEPAPVSCDEVVISAAEQTSSPLSFFSDERNVAPPLAARPPRIARIEPVLRAPSAERAYPLIRPNPPAAAPPVRSIASTIAMSARRKAPAESERRRKATPARVTASLAILAMTEAAIIGGLVYVKGPLFGSAAITIDSPQPGSDVIVDGRSAGVTPLTLKLDSATRSVRIAAPTAAGRTRLSERIHEPAPVASDHPLAVPGATRTGRLALASPVDVDVLENGRLLGSNTKPITLAPGAHDLELVNTTLGYHSRETVHVKTGQTTSLAVALPNGRLSLNALPWAEVWIDGKSVGETPLGNVALPIGPHEVVFRHPQLGERRQFAVVRADAVSRVSVNLQQ
jgi:PEGA domain-containing protein